MKDGFHSPLYDHSSAIILLAVYSLDSAIQKNFFKLASATRTIRKHLLNLENEISPWNVLTEMDETIVDWWECEYLSSSLIFLPTPDTKYQRLSSSLG